MNELVYGVKKDCNHIWSLIDWKLEKNILVLDSFFNFIF